MQDERAQGGGRESATGDAVLPAPSADGARPPTTAPTTAPTAAFIRALLADGEGAHADFKLECHAFHGGAAANAELVKDICALANGSPARPRHDGVLVVGVGDDRMTFQSVRNAKLTDDAMQDLVRTSLYPPPDVHLHDVEFEDAGSAYALKVVTVSARSGPIVRIRRDLTHDGRKGGLIHRANEVWVRRGATNELASPEDIVRLHERDHPRGPARSPRLAMLASAHPQQPAAGAVTVSVAVPDPLDTTERRRQVEALLAGHRPLDVRVGRPELGGRSYEMVCHRAEVERYEREAVAYVENCEQYVDALQRYEQERSRRAYLYFDLVNDGAAAATHVVVTVAVPAGLLAVSPQLGSRRVVLADRPRLPAPPTPPRPDSRVPLHPGPAAEAEMVAGAAPRVRPQPTSVVGPHVERVALNGAPSLIRYEVPRVPHGDPVQLDAIGIHFVEVDSVADFALDYAILADEVEAPVRGRIAVSVVRRTRAVGPLDGGA